MAAAAAVVRRSTMTKDDRSLILLLLIASLLQFVVKDVDAATTKIHEKKWKLYHSWDNGKEFHHRSDVVLSVKDGAENAELDITQLAEDEDAAMFDPLATKQWIETHPNGMYQLKLIEENEDGDDDDDDDSALMTSVPACELLRANFREEIILRFASEGSAISFSYIPLVSPLAPKACLRLGGGKSSSTSDNENNLEMVEHWNAKKFSNRFDTQRISYETSTAGMTLRPIFPQYKPPPGVKFLPRMNNQGKLVNALPGQENSRGGAGGGGGTDGEGNPEEQQGFLRRYWYIIVPIMIANLIGGQAPEEEQQGEGGEGGQQQQQQQQQRGGGGGEAPKQRRGKRG